MGCDEIEKPDEKGRSTGKAISRLRHKCCSGTCLKFVYLACATLVSASIIIECILTHLVITPYISESVFESGVCFLYYTATGKKVKCENKCSKDRSAFPCANVQVIYFPLLVPESEISAAIEALKERRPEAKTYLNLAEARLLYLYDYFSTYATYKIDKCSTSPCNRREADNVETVEQYLRELHDTGLLPCHARPLRRELSPEAFHAWQQRNNNSRRRIKHFFGEAGDPAGFLPFQAINWLRERTNISGDEAPEPSMHRLLLSPHGNLGPAALMHRVYPDVVLFHSLFWPLAITLCCLMLIGLAYSVDGCKVWRTDMTVIA